ncbi:MAG: hypothetical protein CUN52_12235 [Phototrophicales bacterium]|nr:MAG: hypothetical protein CUN52_12235 [Phototrophicales bacterium]
MQIIMIISLLIILVGIGFWIYTNQKKSVSPKTDVQPRDHEALYEIPAVRMTEDEELTDSFIVELKKIKKYRDEITKDDNQE